MMQKTPDFSPDLDTPTPALVGSRIISKVLSPAIRFWLKTQADHLDACDFQIQGQDRQILAGYIPEISVLAQGAVYQGLHLSQVTLTGRNIRINLPQVLRGKPLQLLEPIRVMGAVRLQEADLNASLKTPLFANAVTEFLRSQPPFHLWQDPESHSFTVSRLLLSEQQLTIEGRIGIEQQTEIPFILKSELKLVGHQLIFEDPCIESVPPLPTGVVENFILELGTDVELESLTVVPGELIFQGELLIRE